MIEVAIPILLRSTRDFLYRLLLAQNDTVMNSAIIRYIWASVNDESRMRLVTTATV